VRLTSDRPLVLGSASPRRRELVGRLGVPMIVRAADVDESQWEGEGPNPYLHRMVQAKLEAIRGDRLGGVGGILVADTIVVAPDGAVLGKPRSDEEAVRMLERLSGSTHDVRTRFVLAEADSAEGASHAQTVTTHLWFRALSPSEVAAYTATGEGRDKAGAYAVQGIAAAFVERIEGSYTNVVGLPLCEVVVAMRARGWI
jgi:septum formation protein